METTLHLKLFHKQYILFVSKYTNTYKSQYDQNAIQEKYLAFYYLAS